MLFVLAFKLGDMALGPMVRPFWVDSHFTPVQIGAIPGTLGVISTIAGALVGGHLTGRWGVFRALWVLGIAQAASNLVYAGAAALPPSTPLMYAASVVESFCGGLGTAPFLALPDEYLRQGPRRDAIRAVERPLRVDPSWLSGARVGLGHGEVSATPPTSP